MALYDDQFDPGDGTSIVAQDDPFLTWYHGTQAPTAPAIPPVEDPNEIQMPAEDARVQMGFPVDPGAVEQPEIEMPAEDARPGASSPAPMGLQPGLGVPQAAFDAGAAQVAPLEVDAISGGDWRANVPTAPGGNEYEQPGPTGTQLTPEQSAQMFRRSSPEEQARQLQAWTEQRDQRDRELRDRADLEQKQREVENHAAIQKSIADARAATEKLNADAAKLAEQELDTSWKAGPGKRIAGIILGIVGGLVQSRQGGANQGLAIIDADLANQIEARKLKMANQRAELQRRGASIQQLLAFDMQQHEETVRYGLATYERAKSEIASQMQQYDRRGKTALQLGQTYAALDQARAKALAEYETNYQKNWVEMYKLDQEDRKIRISEGELALKQAKAAGAGGAAKPKEDDVVYTPEQWAAMGVQGVAQPMSLKQLKKIQPLVKGGQDIVAGQSQGQSKEEAERGIPGLKNPDGKPFIWQGRAEDAQAFKKKKVAAEKIIRLIDDALATRTGWSSDVGNSKERQELAVLWGNAMIEAKNMAELGQLTEGDHALIVGILGTHDPSKFRDPTEGMKKAREVIIANLRQELKDSGGFKGTYDRPYIEPTKPKETAQDKAQKAAMHDTSATDVYDAVKPKAKTIQQLADEVKYGAADDTDRLEAPARSLAGEIPAAAKKHIDGLAAELEKGSATQKERATDMLEELAGSPNKATAEYARDVLHRGVLASGQADIDARTSESGPVTSTAYEEAPPLPPTAPNKKKGGR